VEPVRRKDGIRTVGYWTEPGNPTGGKFIYLLRSPSQEELQKREAAFAEDPAFKEGYAANAKKYGRTLEKINALPLSADPTAELTFAISPRPRTFELRIYSILPGKMDAFRGRWRDHATGIYARHGLQSLGWWVAAQKDAKGHEQFVCLLAGESMDRVQQSIAAFHADPEWQRVERESEQGGALRSGVATYLLAPTDFSPVR